MHTQARWLRDCVKTAQIHTDKKIYYVESDVTYSQVWGPILWFLCSAINPSKVHIVNTLPGQWAAIDAAAPGEQCLAQGHLSRGIEHSLPPPTPETWTYNLWITSQTL